MVYSIALAQPGDPLPVDLLLLADENQPLIDAYLPRSQVYLLAIDTQTRGVCVLQRQDESAEIMNIAIDPAYQNRGLGKALLLHTTDVARQQRVHRLLIKTGNSGIGQIALYQRIGFNLIGVNYDYFLRAYPQPIWENSIRCRHQLIFELVL